MDKASGSDKEKEIGSSSGGGAPTSRVGSARSNLARHSTTAGSRTNVAWSHGVAVDGDARKIKCKYCGNVYTGGVYRVKHHLAGTKQNVGACLVAPEDIQMQMLQIIGWLQDKHIQKSYDGSMSSSTDELNVGKSRKEEEVIETVVVASVNPLKRRSQSTINTIFKKNLKEDACLEIASFFYNNAIPFNVAKSEEFHKMCDMIARHRIGFKPPSYHELRVKYLKQKVQMTQKVLENHKACWSKTGYTIMTDGWTNKKRRTILNFLVNSPIGIVFLKSIDASNISKTADKIFKMLDEVVEEVGEDNVVQVVKDNAANYKADGEMLMEKRMKLYWILCAAHCINLMLEDFEKKIPLHKDTIANGKKITTYIYSNTGLVILLRGLI